MPLLMRMRGFGDYISNGTASTLKARDYKDATDLITENKTIRRLTPLECGRLQGFPDDWCHGLINPDPSVEELTFWAEVFKQWQKATGSTAKPKTEIQIRKWLGTKHSDSAEYKMWGNGIALPCAEYVLGSIKHYEDRMQLKPCGHHEWFEGGH